MVNPSLDMIDPLPVPRFIGTEKRNCSCLGGMQPIAISSGFDDRNSGIATD